MSSHMSFFGPEYREIWDDGCHEWQTIAFRGGTLVLEFPFDFVARSTEVEFRSNGPDWCARLCLDDGGVIIGAGTSSREGSHLHVTGGQVDSLPEWWARGQVEEADPWSLVEALVAPGQGVEIGSG